MTWSGERVARVVYPDGQLRAIPLWMIEPQTEELALRESPRISIQSLHQLRHVLAVTLSLREEASQSKGSKEDAP